MGRKRRFWQITDNSVFHMTWQCHNKSNFLDNEKIKKKYYELLYKNAFTYGVRIYGYNFMSTHIHLVGKVQSIKAFIKFQQIVNSCLAKFINTEFCRYGQAIRDRYEIKLVKNDLQLLTLLMYLDMNPVRAGIVSHPCYYKWTSYHFYADGKPNPILSQAPSFIALSKSEIERRKKYSDLLNAYIKKEKEFNKLKKSYTEKIESIYSNTD